MMLIIIPLPPSLMTIMIVSISGISITVIADVPTMIVGIAFDERLEKRPHPCRKRRHAGGEVGFEGRPGYRIFEKLA
ncbi:hypothetical protein [Methylocella tundrae]|uniref:hypothetical protein n=1 Tax=Methylocella tundrae TaxID=227605 RepID=UPI001FCE62A1|nr:hypothetical protein [Methylocella tundrae]